MAYDQTQGGDEGSWSQRSDAYRRRAPFPATVVCDTGAEQTLRVTAPSSGFGGYPQRWMPVSPEYPQPYGIHYPNSGYQQPLSLGHNTVESSAYQSHTDAVSAPQSSPIAQFEYTPPNPFPGGPRYVSTYPPIGYNTHQGYHAMGTTQAPLTTSMSASYQGPTYPYVAPASSVPASPPTAIYPIPPIQVPEGSHIDAEYSVPCPYRCGTVLTGVHALGNLTRHLKTQACAGSSRAKVRYPCPIDGCGRQYARSDGLRVHMRRRHGAPPPVPRTDGVVDEDED